MQWLKAALLFGFLLGSVVAVTDHEFKVSEAFQQTFVSKKYFYVYIHCV